jgi:uncharacterized protein YigA (DUF484 family)
MSASNEPATVEPEISEAQVREYLVSHGDFLQRNPDLMDHLHIAHASGSAVSLVEKQVSVLRDRNVEMRHRLNKLTANARENEALYEQTRGLVLRLLEARSLDELFERFLASMDQDFKVEYATMVLFGEQPEQVSAGRFEDPAGAGVISSLLRGRKAICGPLREDELRYLFPDLEGPGSAAVMPLFDGREIGLLAVGSSDVNRYSGDMGTLFLHHVADVIIRLLPRWLPEAGV